jgi:hypothetical protein
VGGWNFKNSPLASNTQTVNQNDPAYTACNGIQARDSVCHISTLTFSNKQSKCPLQCPLLRLGDGEFNYICLHSAQPFAQQRAPHIDARQRGLIALQLFQSRSHSLSSLSTSSPCQTRWRPSSRQAVHFSHKDIIDQNQWTLVRAAHDKHGRLLTVNLDWNNVRYKGMQGSRRVLHTSANKCVLHARTLPCQL